jgi:hypothetical protein
MAKKSFSAAVALECGITDDDLREIFSDDVETTDVRYSAASIYKYYNFDDIHAQERFFTLPTLKFAHKSELNDHFELSRRWAKFGCPFTEAMFDKYVRRRFAAKLADTSFIAAKFRQKAEEQGISLSRQQVRKFLRSREGKTHISNAHQSALGHLDSLVKLLPRVFRDHEAELVESFARETGILSLTEDPASKRMWKKYADCGRGFLVEFNAKHEFFSYADSKGKMRNVLRKVFYRNDRIDDFWTNPNYLFLVKETEWEYEKEWRMIKSLADCRRIDLLGQSPIYLIEMPAKIIRSITFGSLFSKKMADELSSLILRYDSNITILQA